MITVPHDQPIEIPVEVAICPYCKTKLTINPEGWTEDDDKSWFCDDFHTDCNTEPDIDMDEWEDWFKQHTYMPYVYMLPVIDIIKKWLYKNYRFDMEKSYVQ